MTLEFTTPVGSYTDAIKFSMNAANCSGQMLLATQQVYSKNLHTYALNIVETNGRYTEFATDYTDDLGDLDISGFYFFTLYQDGVERFSGLLKMINNKTKSLQNKDKYVSPNENGDSYVIY